MYAEYGKCFEPRDFDNKEYAWRIVEPRWFRGVRTVDGQATQTSATMLELLCRRLVSAISIHNATGMCIVIVKQVGFHARLRHTHPCAVENQCRVRGDSSAHRGFVFPQPQLTCMPPCVLRKSQADPRRELASLTM
jgi:hypothetical protein